MKVNDLSWLWLVIMFFLVMAMLGPFVTLIVWSINMAAEAGSAIALIAVGMIAAVVSVIA